MSERSRRYFTKNLQHLGFKTYNDYLASPHWRDFKARFWSDKKTGRRRRRQCAGCKEPATQIHHKTYRRLGSEHLRDVVALCRKCHLDIHASEPYIASSYVKVETLRHVTAEALKRKRRGTFDSFLKRERAKGTLVQREQRRQAELAKLVAEQKRDMARRSPP